MLPVFIIILFILAAGAYALSRRARNSLGDGKEGILPPPTEFEGLFDKEHSEHFAVHERESRRAQRRDGLLERARQFDLGTLDETRAEAELYDEVLGELIRQAGGRQDRFQALVGHVSESRTLKANAQLAEAMMTHWEASLDNRSTARMLHIAALTDDAAVLERAIDMAAEALQGGLLPKLSANDFLALAESEYWVLAPEARRSGAAFILKNSLAELRRTLVAAKRGSHSE